jgi:hypothetical protein
LTGGKSFPASSANAEKIWQSWRGDMQRSGQTEGNIKTANNEKWKYSVTGDPSHLAVG